MEVVGAITRATPIVGLVRKSSSFMQAGSPSMMIDGLPNPGFVPPIVLPVGQTSSVAARAMNGLAPMGGVAGEGIRPVFKKVQRVFYSRATAKAPMMSMLSTTSAVCDSLL
jgi:hypothetical protein